MELYMRRDAEFMLLYNCSFYRVDQVPLKERQDFWFGLLLCVVGVVEEVLYVPCLVAIWRHMENSCYKIMFAMGVLDLLVLPVPSIFSGFFGMVGAVYCSYPDLMYLLGTWSFSLWFVETCVEFVLAFNRCVDVLAPKRSDKLFKGRRTWLWMVPPILYGLYNYIYEKAGFFNGIYFMWLPNPHFGYADEMASDYKLFVLSVHNWLVIFGLSGIYLLLGIGILLKSKQNQQNTLAHKMIFVQVMLISSMNVMAASCNALSSFIVIPKWLAVVAQFGWSQAHGIPPLIYLTMNRTIRDDCLQMWRKLTRRPRQQVSTVQRVSYHRSPVPLFRRSVEPTAHHITTTF